MRGVGRFVGISALSALSAQQPWIRYTVPVCYVHSDCRPKRINELFTN